MILLTRSLQKAKLNFRGVTPDLTFIAYHQTKIIGGKILHIFAIPKFWHDQCGYVHRFSGKILLSNFNEEVIERKI